MTKVSYLYAVALMALAACSPVRTVTPEAPPVSPQITTNPTAGQVPEATTQPAGVAPSPAPPQPNAGPVSLQVLAPEDGAVVNGEQIQVTGTASPGAVVTVNDDILIAGGDGSFQTTLSLVEGPNLIEVVASNTSGSESTVQLVVTYEP